MAGSIPKLISGTGFYANMSTKAFGANVTPFEVNAPLWTDGAVKNRFIALPPGTSAIFNDTADTYVFPERAMIIKNFAVDTIPATRIPASWWMRVSPASARSPARINGSYGHTAGAWIRPMPIW